MHQPEDYYAVNEVGRELNMKIIGPLCLGEWDKDNLLHREVGISWDPEGWNRRDEIDYPLAESCLRAAESCDYIEYAIHGLLHGNYTADGKQINEQEYFVRKEVDGKNVTVPIEQWDLLRRLDLFYKIYSSWGFTKKIRTIVSPGGVSSTATFDDLRDFAREFRRRGLIFWPNGWYQIDGAHHMLDGVMCMRETGGGMVPWNAFDYDPEMLSDIAPVAIETKRSVFGLHWPNFFRFNPKRYLDHKDAWVAYFRRQAEYFGCMLSRDIAFAANQELHAARAELTEENGKLVVDLTRVAKCSHEAVSPSFFISFKHGTVPDHCTGGTAKLYERHSQFDTYSISYSENIIEIFTKEEK